MSKFIYLTCLPEALVGSMLPPELFGLYLSTGTRKRNKSQVIFFEVDFEKVKDLIDMQSLNSRCIPKEDGSPKSSVYLSVYKVLETVPLDALKSLYLATDNGLVLELNKTDYDPADEAADTLHLYQELCPVSPLVASILPPSDFLRKLTDGSTPIVLPKLFFVEMKLGELANNPLGGSVDHLCYLNTGHLRDCLEILRTEKDKLMKTVRRVFTGNLLYQSIESGFYVGSGDSIVFYRYPSMQELQDINYEFFRAI